jgi:uncharacterized protein YbjT (DUF2867 family)
MVRRSSNRQLLPGGVDIVEGDLDDPESLRAALQGVDMLVNIASLGFGHGPAIAAAAAAACLRRAVFVSTTAVFTTLNARSKSVRLDAETAIRDSGVPYTILRPTMIYGGPGDRNMWRLISYLRRRRVMPVMGSGRFLHQPVYVDDVASAIVAATGSAAAVGKSYNVAGGTRLTFNQTIDTIATLLGRRTYKIHIPVAPAVFGLAALRRLGLRLPISAEQVLRLNEDKVFDVTEAERDLAFRPRSFADGIRCELAHLPA